MGRLKEFETAYRERAKKIAPQVLKLAIATLILDVIIASVDTFLSEESLSRVLWLVFRSDCLCGGSFATKFVWNKSR